MSVHAVDRDWFARPATEVAADLLGAVLTTTRAGATVSLRLTEVEAYCGAVDPVSHAFRGRTGRNASMFLVGGHLYVYRHLGLHHCVNIVTGPAGEAGAVLLRAGEVVDGTAVARARRTATGAVHRVQDLARGPARLVVALGLGPDDDGLDLLAGPAGDGAVLGNLAVGPGAEHHGSVGAVPGPDRTVLAVPSVLGPARSGPRVGVGAAGRDPERFPWRFWLTDEVTVSADRGPSRPRRSGRGGFVAGGPPRTAD